jgi:hypothetical protein
VQVSGVLSKLKKSAFPHGARPRVIPFGLYRGITLDLDFGYQLQHFLGLWERETYSAIRAVAKNVEWAIDVGAGRGELCIYLSVHGRSPQVYAFEPDRQELTALRKNLGLSDPIVASRVNIIDKLVGTHPGEVRLDDLPLDRTKRGFIKIDVEGAEIDVLQSAHGLLTTNRPALLVEVHSASLEDACLTMLQGLQYKVRIIKNAWWRPILPEQRPLPHNRWLIAT